jgi:hypothetical protein
LGAKRAFALMFSVLNADTYDVVINHIQGRVQMKMNPIDLYELIEVEELEEKSAPSADASFIDIGVETTRY